MSAPNESFEDFRADVLFLRLSGEQCWPPTEAKREHYRTHKCRPQFQWLECAIADLWEQAHTAALFAIDQSRAGQRPVGSHTADIADANPNLAPDTVSFDEQDDPC